MEDIKTRIISFGPMRFAFDLNLSNERGDGLDGIRHGEEPYGREAPVRQAGMNALPDGPDLGFAGQTGEGLDGVVGYNIVELTHQTLVGTEYDGTDPTGMG